MNATWIAAFERVYSRLPADYLVFDCETTGLKSDDLPLEIGHVIVRDGEVVNRGSFLLDWSRHHDVTEDFLEYRIGEVNRRIVEFGEDPPITLEALKKRGVDPEEVLRFYLGMFADNRAAGAKLVGQNAVRFDSPLLSNAFRHFLGEQWFPEADEIYDTYSIAKAAENGVYPRSGEPLLGFMRRAANSYARGKSLGLSKLAERYGVRPVGKEEFHTAGYDAYITTLIFEEQRKWFTGVPT